MWFCLGVAWGYSQQRSLLSVHRSERLMGTRVDITVTAESEEIGYINIEEALAEIRKVEQRISSWNPDSETSKINAQAGIRPVEVSPELFNLLQRAVKISELTQGAFDITTGALDTLWRFDGSVSSLPTKQELERVLPLVGYRQLVLDPEARTAYLPRRGMKINLGGIGKGYAADRAKDLMLNKEVPGGMINMGGDITVWGSKASGEKWLLGVADPLRVGQILSWIPLIESSVAMARPMQQYIEYNGLRYGRVFRPDTGEPVRGIRQVTVLARSAELSDALATALCVMGPDQGIRMVEQLGDTEAIVVDSDGFLYWTSGLMLERQ